MKRIIYGLLAIVILFSCTSPDKLIEKGEYDHAIRILVKKLKARPDNEINMQRLVLAFRSANQINTDRIKKLRETGQPDIWYKVYQNYDLLNKRQDYVNTLPEETLNMMILDKKDYATDLNTTKVKASAYFYAHAEKLLDEGSKLDARTAYDELTKITHMYDDYKNVDELMRKALIIGTDYILYRVIDKSGMILPSSFIYNLQNINLLDLDEKFLNFDISPVEGRVYNYTVVLNLRNIDLSPQRVRESQYTETKKVIRDYEVKKDDEGNDILDDKGDPVRVPVYKTVSCNITEVEKHKSVTIRGFVDFLDNTNKKVVNSTPVSAESVFYNISAYAKGDITACSEETLELLNQPKLPFPDDNHMLQDAGHKLEDVVKQVIWHDESYVNR